MIVSPPIYVRFDAHAVSVLNARSGVEFRDKPVLAARRSGASAMRVVAVGAAAEALREPGVLIRNPFDHERLVIHEFEVAEAILRYGFTRVLGSWHLIRPLVVMHPLRDIAARLTDIERRALIECALSAGGRMAVVHIGPELRPDEVACAARPSSEPAV